MRPRPDLPVQFRIAETGAEEQVAGLWAKLLDVDVVGVDDHFMDLGGDSLFAVQLAVDLMDIYGIEMSPIFVYDHPTVSGLVRAVGGHRLTQIRPRQ